MLLVGPTIPDKSKDGGQTNLVKPLQAWPMQVLTSHRKHKMTLDLHGNSYCIARHTGKQGVHPVNASQVADKKSITENNDNNNDIDITSSAPTLNKHQKARKEGNSKERKSYHLFTECTNTQNFQLHKFVATTEELLNDTACVQEQCYIHERT